MIDWKKNEELLFQDSERLIRALFAHHEQTQKPLAAIGYAYEFASGQPCFELCANTVQNAQHTLAEAQSKYPDASVDEFRWNSGDYDYPGAADQHGGGWSKAWWSEVERLSQWECTPEEGRKLYEGTARICCHVLAELARRGVLGDWRKLDFNVAALLDEIPEVMQRDQRIRQLIDSSE